jgi:hypothetical protein
VMPAAGDVAGVKLVGSGHNLPQPADHPGRGVVRHARRPARRPARWCRTPALRTPMISARHWRWPGRHPICQHHQLVRGGRLYRDASWAGLGRRGRWTHSRTRRPRGGGVAGCRPSGNSRLVQRGCRVRRRLHRDSSRRCPLRTRRCSARHTPQPGRLVPARPTRGRRRSDRSCDRRRRGAAAARAGRATHHRGRLVGDDRGDLTDLATGASTHGAGGDHAVQERRRLFRPGDRPTCCGSSRILETQE